jgi:hypothetical protein
MKQKYTWLFLSTRQWAWLLFISGLVVHQQALAQFVNCGTLDPGGNPSRSGLYSEYYANYFNESPAYFNNNTPGLTRIDAQVNFTSTGTWSTQSSIVPPAGGTAGAPTNFSVRLRGGIYLPTAGDYIFYMTSDDGSYLWVDGQAGQPAPAITSATINNGGGHGSQMRQATVTGLAAGWHNMQLLYGDSGGGNNLMLEYSGPNIARQIVPNSALCTGYRPAPSALTYSPTSQLVPYQTSASSGTPTVTSRNSAVTGYAVANASSLPAGITINPTTGVLTAAATVLPGSYTVNVAATNSGGTTTFAGVYTFLVSAPCGGVDPYGNAAQAGLLAEYYKGYFNDQPAFFTNNTAFALGSTNNPARIQRAEGTPSYLTDNSWSTSGLNLFSAGIAAGSNAQPTNFSARYRGKIYISVAGTYTFSLASDDASDLIIDGSATAQVAATPYTVDNGGGHSVRTVTGTATLSTGWHSLVLLYGNSGSSSYLLLQYAGPADSNISLQTIPSNILCTGIESVPTGLGYSSASTAYAAGSTASSGNPTVYRANTTPVTYAITNSASLPAGITINTTTGVLAADATLAPGAYVVSLSATNSYGTSAFPSVFTFNVLAAGCTGNDAGGSAAQSGFYSEYYAGYFGAATGADTDANLTYFTTNTPKLKAVAAAPNVVANGDWSTAGLNLVTAGVATGTDAAPTLFSARYRGRIYIGTAGTYTFYLNTDDAAYVFLDEAATASPLVINNATVKNGGVHGSGTVQSGSKFLAAGLHDVQVLYGQNGGNTYFTLQYAGPANSGVAQQVIPAAVLCSSSSPRPLPVTLARFDAQALGAVVAVNWATASEQSSASFEVERSTDGAVFTKMGQVAAAGTTSQGQQYQWLDRAPLAGLSYYRLRQLDLDGTAHYSPVVPVRLAASATAPLLTLAPNPTTGRVVVQLVQATAQAAALQVLDALGRTVYQQALPAAATQEQTLDLQALPAGVYLVRVTSAAGVATQRLVRQ